MNNNQNLLVESESNNMGSPNPYLQNNNLNANPYMSNQNDNFNNNHQEKLNDIEGGNYSSEDVHAMMRIGFIRKVFGILSAQMALTVAFMSLSFIDSFNFYLTHNLTLFWVAFGLSLVIILPLLCFKSLARGVPTNYILLFLWTLCEGYMLATCCATYEPQSVMLAGVMTVAVTVSLCIYACTTKTDFTFCGGILFSFSCILLVWSLFSIIFGFYSNTLYCILGLCVYSIYLIYDVQLIMGKFGAEYGVDDYIYAALTIYLDIIQIFLYLLQLFGKRK